MNVGKEMFVSVSNLALVDYLYIYIEIMNYILNHTCLICVTFRVMNQRYKFVYSSRKHLFSFFITNRFHSDYPLKFTHERFVLYSTIPPPKRLLMYTLYKSQDLCKGLNGLNQIGRPDLSKVTIFQMWFINQQNDIS